MSVIAVDMTPMLSGGKNGGAKIVALELLKSFKSIAPEDRFLILTASWNHDELAILDGSNMRRLCILTGEKPRPKQFTARYPGRLKRNLGKIYRMLRRRLQPGQIWRRPLTSQGIDLLFCPFTALTHAEPGIPVVSLIHDLQHRDYPWFFSPYEIDQRDSFLGEVCRRANAIICISEYTRQAVIRHLKIRPEKTHVVHNCIQARLINLDPTKVSRDLTILGIDRRPYMFYPANFWPHKNHRMLLTAYGMFLSRNPDQKIDLVFTGASDDSQEELKDVVSRMGLVKHVHFLGFLPDDQLAAVWQGCEFLIFPSLYEGFGIPVLEAISFGKPVLCSNATSLPEVAGDAALYFDPRRPGDMVQCLEGIVSNPSLATELINRGNRRVTHFRPEAMSHRYLEIFYSTIRDSGHITNGVTGVFEDGWTGEEIVVTYGSGTGSRFLEVRLEVPIWLPFGRVIVRLVNKGRIFQKYKITRGEEVVIRQPLSEKGGCFSLLVTPTFVPCECDMGEDNRRLGIMCHGCWIVSQAHGRISLLKGAG